jgi:amidohydrolase
LIQIFENPELAFEEHQAHDNIVKLLKSKGFAVTQHAHDLETSFEAEYGSGGRVVVFNAEYDALPGIGHACGHNLIATASIAAFLGIADALKQSGKEGRVRLLGTPGEEGKCGKGFLVAAGAYKDVDAALMLHPGAMSRHNGRSGTAYAHTLANEKIVVNFKGKAAHASMYPFNGVNALDAVMLSYSAISMLRQQIKPYERIHGIVVEGGKATNVIPDSSTLSYVIRSNTKKEASRLKARVLKCFEGAAIATGCDWEIDE